MSRHSPYEIVLTHQQRVTSEQTARALTPHRDVVRAKIVLFAADGWDNKDIAARLDTSPQVVHKWRKRFYEEGIQGLEDRPRTGRPLVFSPSTVIQVKALACELPRRQPGPAVALELLGTGPRGRHPRSSRPHLTDHGVAVAGRGRDPPMVRTLADLPPRPRLRRQG